MTPTAPRRVAQGQFLAGLRAISPILLGIFPFATISGVAAGEAGLSLAQAFAMSVGIFAGASQLASVQLIRDHANGLVIVLTAIVINLRMAMYSASIADHFRRYSLPVRAFLSYFLTDQAYAVSITHFQRDEAGKGWYYFGAAIAPWTVWQLGTAMGLLLGASVPPSWSLDFAIPLTFIALVMPNIRNRASASAAMAAVLLAVAAHGLPYNLGLLTAAIGGIGVGMRTGGYR